MKCPLCKKDKSKEEFDNLADDRICDDCFENVTNRKRG